jgi:hypothetical protein
MDELKKELLGTLNKFLIKDLIFIIFHYAATYNSEKLVDKIAEGLRQYPVGIAVNNKNIFMSDIQKILVYDKKTNELLYTFGKGA